MGMTQKRGLSDTQGALPSQTGSTTPAPTWNKQQGQGQGQGHGGMAREQAFPAPAPSRPSAAPWRARPPLRRPHPPPATSPDPAQHLGERGHPLRQLSLHLGQRLRPSQRLLQLLLRQLQALLQLAVFILRLQSESRAWKRAKLLRQNLNAHVYWISSVSAAASR